MAAVTQRDALIFHKGINAHVVCASLSGDRQAIIAALDLLFTGV
ncbi:MAG: hypothetical protein WBM03_10380 [Steroidobacteraceae bacterium]